MSDQGGRALLYRGLDWDFDTIRRVYAAIDEIAQKELGLDTYPNQIEVISAEQMLDAYASNGLPINYAHWSFGKRFAQHEAVYRKGWGGLAYEIVINSDPCISYIMEANTATMQTLVIAHAAFGHNHFFKNNYLFRAWTDAEGIINYLDFAKKYITRCEEEYGKRAVEVILDAAHALTSHGVHHYQRRKKPELAMEERRERERQLYHERVYDDLWRTVPTRAAKRPANVDEARRRALLDLPQENLLYFIERTAPRLRPWQREILRIVRQIAQYFYPQGQTQVMNEGCATYCHYAIMNRLSERGQISDGHFLEFLQSHTNVVFQPSFEQSPRINPYALGFAMMSDIHRICIDPTEEDREWFPDIAGSGSPTEVLKSVWAEYRDESFILQYLSPRLIREWRFFHLVDDPSQPHLRVAAIHNEAGYRRIRRALARQYDIGQNRPDIQVVDVDLAGDRRLIVHHKVENGVFLKADEAEQVLQQLANLWGYEVLLAEVDENGRSLREHKAAPSPATEIAYRTG